MSAAQNGGGVYFYNQTPSNDDNNDTGRAIDAIVIALSVLAVCMAMCIGCFVVNNKHKAGFYLYPGQGTGKSHLSPTAPPLAPKYNINGSVGGDNVNTGSVTASSTAVVTKVANPFFGEEEDVEQRHSSLHENLIHSSSSDQL